jgi:outer membrane lipoprotein carrier protein
MRPLLISLAACLAAISPAHAGGVDQLRAFVDGSTSGRMTFTQTVVARGNRPPQHAAGTFAFARPGKFRWTYDKPFQQLIVGDGDRVWIYDRDLNQVIVKKLDRALGSSPAALLSGDNALEKAFDLSDGGRADNLEWVEARPKSPDAGFTRIRIGFRDNLPRAMELTDAFGQLTSLAFSGIERNPASDPAQFQFTPPKGADVVGE